MFFSSLGLIVLSIFALLLQESQATISRCMVHEDSTKKACKECYSPYKLTISARCCDPSCLECDADLRCLNCKEGTYYSGEKCNSCGPGCEQCTGGYGCKYCADGYFLNKTTRCEPCMPGCLKCTNSSVCMDCDGSVGSRYYQNGTKCEAIPKYCLNFNPVSQTCSECPERMYISGIQCKNCSENCKVCTNESCDKCDVGFDQTQSGNKKVCVSNIFNTIRTETDMKILLISGWPWVGVLLLILAISKKRATDSETGSSLDTAAQTESVVN